MSASITLEKITVSDPKTIELPCFGITIEDHGEIATITHSGLIPPDEIPETEDEKLFDAGIEGITSLILAHYQAGIDVTTPAYLEGIETAVEAVSNNF